jgi:hypothetical protein
MSRVWLFEAHRLETGQSGGGRYHDQAIRVRPSARFRRWYDEHPGFLMEDGDVSEWFDRTTFVVDRPGRGSASADRYHGGYMLPPDETLEARRRPTALYDDDWDRVREVHMRWRFVGATIYSMLCPDPIPVLSLEHPDYMPATVFNEMRTVPATRVIHRAWRRRWDPEFVAREIEALEAAIEAREHRRHRIRTPSPPRPIAGDGGAVRPPPPPSALPKFVADALVTAAVAAEATCPITMEPISPENAAVTSCFHVFEANAIAIWLTDRHTCPTCKQAAILPA